MSFADKMGAIFSRKRVAILGGIVVLYCLWLYGLSTNPPGFYVDETCLAYSGYLIAQTGAIEDGTSFPLYIHCYTQGWSQHASPAQPYAFALLYSIISPSVISARIFAATTVFLAILLLGLLAARISGRRSVGIIVALSGMATPWLFEYSRLVMETFILILSYSMFLLFLYNACKKEKWTIADNFLIAISLSLIAYSYSGGRFVAPFFAFGLLIFVTNKRALWDVFKTWIIFAVTMIPLLVVYYRTPLVVSGRFLRATNLSRDASILQNIWTVVTAFYQDLNPDFFIFTGDPLVRHHIPDTGIGEFLVGTFALGILGIVIILIRHRSDPWWRFILFATFVSMLPGAFSYERDHSMRRLAFPILFLIMTVPAISWLMGLYRNQRAEITASGGESDIRGRTVTGGAGFFRSPATERFLRLGLLSALLILTAVQAVQFQRFFRQNGEDATRKAVFHESYPRILDRALEEGDRPIYLQDYGEPTYLHALWYGATKGVDKSNFVHLLDRQGPPEGALVLSGKVTCSDCQVISLDGLLLYRNQKVDMSLIPSPIPANPLKAPSVFTAGPGSGPAQLSRPRGIATDADGNLYVADSANARIQKFDPEGKFVIEFGMNGPSEITLRDPNGVAVDADGNVYVVDAGTHQLVKFNAEGIFENTFGGADNGFYGPRDLALGRNKQIYIIDQGRQRIAAFDLVKQDYPLVWGTPGEGEGQFIGLTGIAVGDDLVFAAEVGNGRIQVSDLAGKFVNKWEIPSWTKTDPHEVEDVVFDENTKTVYVTSSKTNQILAFDVDGNPKPELEIRDSEKLFSPGSMAISEANNKRWLNVINGNASAVRFELENPKKRK